MGLRAVLLCIGTWLVTPGAWAEPPSGDDYVARTSLPTETAAEAWSMPGFRLALGLAYTYQTGRSSFFVYEGMRALPGGQLVLRPGYRISSQWSAALVLDYGAIPAALVFGTVGEATFHPVDQLGLSLRGGMTAVWTPGGRRDDPNQNTWLVGLGVEYQFVVGHLFATGPVLQVDLTGLKLPPSTEDFGSVIGTFGWWFSWR